MPYSDFHGIMAENALDAFVIAASTGKLKEMKALLADGVAIDAAASHRSSPALCAAAGAGHLKAVTFLLEAGAAIEVTDGNEMTPLMNACAKGGKTGAAVVARLLETGADVNAVRLSDDMTPLKFAVRGAGAEIVRALLDAGAEVDGPEGTDQTALMIAARHSDVEALKLLVDHGADTERKCGLKWADNRTALGLAELEKRRKAVAFLSTVSKKKPL